MAWACSGKTNIELINNMLNAGLFKSERVGEVSSNDTPGCMQLHLEHHAALWLGSKTSGSHQLCTQ
jgi:hypothetical protein